MLVQRGSTAALFLFLILAGGGCASANWKAPPRDGRQWRVGHHQVKGPVEITEFVLPGQSVHGWSELFTILRVRRPTSPALLRAMLVRQNQLLKKKCPSALWRILKASSRDVYYEFAYRGCGAPEHNVSRMVRLDNAIITYTYASKKPVASATRDAWFKRLASYSP